MKRTPTVGQLGKLFAEGVLLMVPFSSYFSDESHGRDGDLWRLTLVKQ